MSADGSIEIDWADGKHKFRLAIGQLRELQDKLKVGPQELMNRFRNETVQTDDPREILRIGLIGGGKSPTDALSLVVRYVDNRPWLESIQAAFVVLMAGTVGVPDDNPAPSGKAKTEKSQDGSASPKSMAPEPQSDLAHSPLMN